MVNERIAGYNDAYLLLSDREDNFHLEMKRLILVNPHFSYFTKCETKVSLEGCI